MATITLTVPDEFAQELGNVDLLEVLKIGWIFYQTKQNLAAKVPYEPKSRLKTVDKRKWEQALLTISAWTDDEIREIEQVKGCRICNWSV